MDQQGRGQGQGRPMKRLAIFLCIAVAILLVVAILTGRLEAAIAAVGLGGGGAGAIANARKAGRNAAEAKRKELENMTDEEVIDSDPAVRGIVDSARAGAADQINRAFDRLANRKR